jgi:hypothetical protein
LPDELNDVLDALMALGYSKKEVTGILAKLDNTKDVSTLVKEALTIGSFLEVELHEINHFIYSLLFISDNIKSLSFKTPRKKKLANITEGGYYFELLLFGKIVNKLTINEALYLLNRNNYNKSLKDFRNGFLNLESKDLIATGNFIKFNNLKFDNPNNKYSSIVVKSSNKELYNDNYIEFNNCNCTCINRKIDFNELKKFVINKK